MIFRHQRFVDDKQTIALMKTKMIYSYNVKISLHHSKHHASENKYKINFQFMIINNLIIKNLI